MHLVFLRSFFTIALIAGFSCLASEAENYVIGKAGDIGQGSDGWVTTVSSNSFYQEEMDGLFQNQRAFKSPVLFTDTPPGRIALPERELGAYRRLGEHPNLVRAFGTFEVNTPPYVVVGVLLRRYHGNLDEFLQIVLDRQTDYLTDRARLRYLRGLASGLGYLHNVAGYTHGDVRTGNCFYRNQEIVIGDYSRVTTSSDHTTHNKFSSLAKVFQFPLDREKSPESLKDLSVWDCKISYATRKSLDVFGLGLLALGWMYPREAQIPLLDYLERYSNTIQRLHGFNRSILLEFRQGLLGKITAPDGSYKPSKNYHRENQEVAIRQKLMDIFRDAILMKGYIEETEYVTRQGECEVFYEYKIDQAPTAGELYLKLRDLAQEFPETAEHPFFRALALTP